MGISDRRQTWKKLKEKHKDALKHAKVDFNLGLGKILDRFFGAVGKNDAEATKQAGLALPIVRKYIGMVEGRFGGTVEKELLEELKTIKGELKIYHKE